MKKLKLLAGMAVVVFVFGLMGWQITQHWEEVLACPLMHRPGALLLHLALVSTTFLCFLAGWWFCVWAIGEKLPFRHTSVTWLIPNLGKYVPGKVLMYAGRMELLHRAGVRRSLALTAAVFELLLMLVAALPFLLRSILSGFQLHGYTMLFAALVLGATITLIMKPSWCVSVLNVLLTRFKQPSLDAALKRGPLVAAFLCSCVAWLAYGAAGMVLMDGVGQPDDASLLTGGCAFVSAWLIGFVSFLTPGGLGVREAALVLLLRGQVAAADRAVLVVVATVSRLSWSVVEMTGVLVGLWLSRSSPGRQPTVPGGGTGSSPAS